MQTEIWRRDETFFFRTCQRKKLVAGNNNDGSILLSVYRQSVSYLYRLYYTENITLNNTVVITDKYTVKIIIYYAEQLYGKRLFHL